MRSHILVVFSSFFLVGLLEAQDQKFDNRIELSGTINFSYSSNNYLMTTAKTTTISLAPSAGFFLGPSFELLVGPSIYASFREYPQSWPGGGSIQAKTENYTFGFRTGAAYHILLDGPVVPFVALSGTLSWQRSITNAGITYPNHWSKPTIIAPSLDVGAKTFLSPDCALLNSF